MTTPKNPVQIVSVNTGLTPPSAAIELKGAAEAGVPTYIVPGRRDAKDLTIDELMIRALTTPKKRTAAREQVVIRVIRHQLGLDPKKLPSTAVKDQVRQRVPPDFTTDIFEKAWKSLSKPDHPDGIAYIK